MNLKTKKCSVEAEYLKYLLVLPAILLILILFPSGIAAQSSVEQTPYVAVEEMPQFPGGDAALFKYLAKNIHYPQAAKEKNIQGKVVIKFCVTSIGGISQISVLQGLNPDVDEEAIRVVKTLPVFTPGKKGGVAVPVWYLVPITFKFKEV
jgi:periplasmic protein TonB